MNDKYRTVHIPEDPIPPHKCRPQGYQGDTKPKHKDGTIIECNDCGTFWWASVWAMGKGTYLSPREYYLGWSKVRWYHFALKKYTR